MYYVEEDRDNRIDGYRNWNICTRFHFPQPFGPFFLYRRLNWRDLRHRRSNVHTLVAVVGSAKTGTNPKPYNSWETSGLEDLSRACARANSAQEVGERRLEGGAGDPAFGDDGGDQAGGGDVKCRVGGGDVGSDAFSRK